MAKNGLEEKVKKLEETIQSMRKDIQGLEKKAQRALDYEEVQNLFSRYPWLHVAELTDEEAELFAKKTPGVSVQIGSWGIWDGYEGAERCYAKLHPYLYARGSKDGKGHMAMHSLTTPIIEVAGDGKTAKGVWISPGHETRWVTGKEKPEANWSWIKYGCDFVKEDGKWRILHLRVYGIFNCPFEKSWVEVAPEKLTDIPSREFPDELKPDRPAPTPSWRYGPNRATEHLPVPPEPYETWDESTAYIPEPQ